MARTKIAKALKETALGITKVAKRAAPIHGKVRFIRVRGRIIPIKSKTASSARTTDELLKTLSRSKAQARMNKTTSLAMKRQSAVRAVRKFRIRLSTRYTQRPLGQGMEAMAFDIGKGKILKQARFDILTMQSDRTIKHNRNRLINRGFIKAILSKKKLAPETFTVVTKKRATLIQEKADFVIGDLVGSTDDIVKRHNLRHKFGDLTDKVKDKIKAAGFAESDFRNNFLNAGVFKGKVKPIDVGLFRLRDFSKVVGFKKRTDKFTIVSKRSKESLKEFQSSFLLDQDVSRSMTADQIKQGRRIRNFIMDGKIPKSDKNKVIDAAKYMANRRRDILKKMGKM